MSELKKHTTLASVKDGKGSLRMVEYYLCSDADPVIAELREERVCVWTRHGSPATEEWIDTGCGFTDVDVEPLYNDLPLNFCPNCGGRIT